MLENYTKGAQKKKSLYFVPQYDPGDMMRFVSLERTEFCFPADVVMLFMNNT